MRWLQQRVNPPEAADNPQQLKAESKNGDATTCVSLVAGNGAKQDYLQEADFTGKPVVAGQNIGRAFGFQVELLLP